MTPRPPGPSGPVVGAVLTGGASRRMGADKALLAVDGVPMAARVAGALRGAGARQVLAVGGDAARLDALGLTPVPDLHPGEGPLGGVLTALTTPEAAGAEVVLVAACDLPWLTSEVVDVVAGGLRSRPEAPVAIARTERPEPLCSAWRPAAAAPLLAALFAAGERRMATALTALAVVEVDVGAGGRAALVNANRPEDLDRRPTGRDGGAQ